MRSILAAAVLLAVSAEAQSCGDTPNSFADLSFDGPQSTVTVGINRWGVFHGCDPQNQVGPATLQQLFVLFSGNGQALNESFTYPNHQPQSVSFTENFGPGDYMVIAQGFATFSFTRDTTIFDRSGLHHVITDEIAQMPFYVQEFHVSTAPEPQVWALLAIGLGGIVWRKKLLG